MYLFLTNHCQMSCAHCCVSASPRGNKYMTDEIFQAALKLAEDLGHGVFLGGGEPTDHPRFFQFLIDLLASNCEKEYGQSGVITNGTNKKAALLIANLAKAAVICGEMSTDNWHDLSLVDNEVLHAFETYKLTRKTPDRVMAFGRAKKLGKGSLNERSYCTCPDLWVNYNGDVYSCACKKRKFGNVLTGVNIPDDFQAGECEKDQPYNN